MTINYQGHGVTLHHGDALDVLRSLPDASVHAVVTDPPYGLEFMGREWDKFGAVVESSSDTRNRDGNWTTPPFGGGGQRVRYGNGRSATAAFGQWCELWAVECLRVLKPGGHLLAFGGTRTWHRLACAVEDAGFEIRDSIAWLYGSGFPKSLNVAKAIASGTGRPEDIRRLSMGDDYAPSGRGRVNYDHGGGSAMNGATTVVDLPDAARQWEGWGTALKPAHEPVVVARKPLVGTVAANVLTHGTGALNIDGCRIEGGVRPLIVKTGDKSPGSSFDTAHSRQDPNGTTSGRWPANVILDEDMAGVLDEQSGVQRDGVATNRNRGDERPMTVEGAPRKIGSKADVGYGGQGGASRFFYVAKAPKRERPVVDGVAHPTVKPLTLMRHLVRLVTPPGGTVLEPFAGSGTTVEACLAEGFQCIAIEKGDEYLPLIRERIRRQTEGDALPEVAELTRAEPSIDDLHGDTLFDLEGEVPA